MSLCGALIGGVVNSIGKQLGNNPTVLAIVNRLGGTQIMENAFVAIAFTILAVAGSAMTISATLRLHQEETAQRGETMLAEAIGRSRWVLSHLAFAVAGSAVAILAAGLVTGLSYGIAVDDVGGKVRSVLAVAAMQLPSIWLLAAVTVALFGLLPRFTPVAWAVLVGFVAIYLLGSIDGFPHWLLDLVPYTHTQRISGRPFRAAPAIWLLLIDIAFIGVGLAAFRRRDLR